VLLPDSNILVYAFRADCPEHQRARAWLEQALDGPGPLALCSAAVVGFVRVVTHPRVFRPPSETSAALSFVEALWSSSVTHAVEPGPSHREIFAELCSLTRASGNDIPDVHLAAVAVESGSELISHDQAFGRFRGLRWSDPIE
jgi:hypothetical protein